MSTDNIDEAITYTRAMESQQEALGREKDALAALLSALADEVEHFANGKGRHSGTSLDSIALFNGSLLQNIDSLCMMNWIMLKKKQSLEQVEALREVLS
jgi:hypothetical protein